MRVGQGFENVPAHRRLDARQPRRLRDRQTRARIEKEYARPTREKPAKRALVYTLTGTVTSGLFTGDTVLQTSTAPATNILLCTLGLGTVSSIYSLVTLAITST